MVDFKYDHIFKSEKANATVKKYLDYFLKELPIARINAEPGSSMVIIAPIPGGEDKIVVDVIPFTKLAMFSGLKFEPSDKDERKYRYYISKFCETLLPIIPDDYDGPLKSYFDSIIENIPSWNRVFNPALMFGIVTANDKRTREEIEKRANEMYTEWLKAIDKAEKDLECMAVFIKKPSMPSMESSSSIFGSVFGAKPKKEDMN